MNTTTKIAATAAGLAVIGLAACDPANDTTATTSTAAVEPIAETTANWSAEPDDTAATVPSDDLMESLYIASLDQVGAYYATEAQAVDAARLLCFRMDNGENLNTIMLEYALTDRPINAGVNTDSTGYVAGAGVRAFCPQHQGQLDEFVATWGGQS